MKTSEQLTPEQLLSRKRVASRWTCSPATVKRRDREGVLHPIRFNQRLIRYALSEIIRVEQEGRAGVKIKMPQPERLRRPSKLALPPPSNGLPNIGFAARQTGSGK